jgi:uncharacterized protein YaaQ
MLSALNNSKEHEMKLILAIVRDTEEAEILHVLVNNGYRVTRMASTGGFLRRGNVTLMIGVDEDKVQTVIDLMKQTCCVPSDSSQHSVTLFVLSASHFEQV